MVILTYALCGFANFGSMGVSLAALGVFAPTRKRTLVKIAPRALIAANMASLMTASIAGNYIPNRFTVIIFTLLFSGLLYNEPNIPIPIINLNSTLV